MGVELHGPAIERALVRLPVWRQGREYRAPAQAAWQARRQPDCSACSAAAGSLPLAISSSGLKGLRDVVVRTYREAHYLVDVLDFGREHDDGPEMLLLVSWRRA